MEPDTVETKTTATTTQSEAFNLSSPSLSLHDCLSLGEIELGLEKRYETRQRSLEEIRRLPYLLRTLSRIRPLASIQSFTKMKKFKSTDECHDDDDDDDGVTVTSAVKNHNHEDDDIDRLVDCLEDVTAMHSVAEGIDVVTNHLAPSMAKTLSRLPPLVRKINIDNINHNEDSDTDYHRCWDTQELSAVARDPISKRRRLRNKNSTFSSTNKNRMLGRSEKDKSVGGRVDAGTTEDTLVATSSDDGYDDEEENNTMTMATDIEDDTVVDRGRHSRHRRDSMKVAAEDSQESTVIKTLSELASLVVASLEPSHLIVPNQDGHDHEHRNDVGGEGEGEENDQKRYPRRMTSTFVLNMDDSILSEKTTGNSCISSTDDRNTPLRVAGGGVMEGSDLCSTIVAILHHAPCLQSRHVANAFCRASIPLTPILMSQLGANCPASIQSLLLGCIEAYSMSIQYHYRLGDSNNYSRSYKGHNGKAASSSCPVVAAAKSGVMALARLSQTESSRVRSKLQSLDVMLDVQIKLAIETKTNIIPVACLLIEHMSISKSRETAPAIPVEETTMEEQPGGDTNNDLASTFTMFCSENAEPSLLFHFVKNPDLYTQTLIYFYQTLKLGASTQSGSGINKCKGKWILILKAYNLLLLVPLTRPSYSSNTLSVYKSSVKAFVELVQNLDCVSDDCRPEMSDIDTLISLVLSCSVFLLSRTLTNTEGRESEKKENIEYVRMMQSVFNICRSTSERSNMIRLSFESEIKKEDQWGLFKNALYPLETTSYIEESYTRNSYRSMQIGLNRFCDLMPVLGGEEGEGDIFLPYKISTQLRVLRSCSESTNEYLLVVEETKKLLGCLLEMDNEGEALSLIDNVESVQFVIKATRFLVKGEGSEVPLVLPAHLDMVWSEIASTWTLSDTETTNGRRCIYLFRFLYAFNFFDIAPKSPFAFDPRSSPIKESLSMVRMLPSKSTRDYLLSELQMLIQKHCPELVVKQFEQELEFQVAPTFNTMNRKSLLDALSKSIQGNFDVDNVKICENNATEQLFLQAKSRVCDADVYCTIINAFLSSPNNPPPNYSYYVLCRDPIVCLKFPLCVWKCQSLRRIALSVLETLLRSNEAITLEESINNDSAFELLMARDAIVARCLLAALHGGDSKNLVVCSMTSTFIRWLIRSRSGLVALLVKQGLQDRDLDWLVENVPETMNDSRCMLQIFSERNYLTSAERLVAADAIIRIAIVHGQSNETESSQLIVIAVSELVDSFYLILGPVGLFPVDALFNADSDTPITQILQKAALRILKSLTRVRGIRTHNIRNEYSMVIQKFMNLCKGELQSGAVTGRRKQLLKELYDAATKADK